MNSNPHLLTPQLFQINDSTSTQPQLSPTKSRKGQLRSPMSKKDPKEISAIIKEKNKLDMIKSKLNEKRQEIVEIKEEIKKLFTKSNNKESELKNYIASLNSKMLNVDVPYDDRIDEMHKSIMTMISEIQEKVKMEINFTKKEMEREVVNKFMEAEQRQHKLMTEKIEEQKRVFEKMNNTRVEIEKIRNHFEQTNSQCESLTKENESLRINLQSLEEDNESLEKKLVQLRKEYILLAREHKIVFKNEDVENPFHINFEEDEGEDVVTKEERENQNDSDDMQMHSINMNMSHHTHHTHHTHHNEHKFSFEMEKIPKKINLNFNYKKESVSQARPQDTTTNHPNLYNNPDNLIEILRDNIKDVKTEYKTLHRNYIEDLRQRNEAQQLLQKCIEDLKLEITKTVKDINSFNKTASNFKKYDEQLAAKQNHLHNLENKIKILTFVYDNGFQNTKMKKNKLFSGLASGKKK